MITPDSVIDALGGTKAVSSALSVDPSTVSVWRNRGIPSGRWLAISKLASAQGIAEITLEALAEMDLRREGARA